MKPSFPGGAPNETLFDAEVTLDTLSPEWTSSAGGVMARIPHLASRYSAGLAGKPITEDVEAIEPIVGYVETVKDH